MVTGALIARDVAADVLTDPNFTEPAILLRSTEGHRINDPDTPGEWIDGAPVDSAIAIVQAPITGQERMTLPEGLRDEDVRTFWLQGDIQALHYGLADGSRILLGGLGQSTNVFSGATRADAESQRDLYGIGNPSWLTAYRNSVSSMIQLRGFGAPVYQRYDAVDGHWQNSDIYRAYRPKRWGPFTEVMAVRQDPGNI